MFDQSYVYHVSPPAHPVLKAEKVSVCRKDQKIKRSKDQMPPERIQRLDDLGFVWQAREKRNSPH